MSEVSENTPSKLRQRATAAAAWIRDEGSGHLAEELSLSWMATVIERYMTMDEDLLPPPPVFCGSEAVLLGTEKSDVVCDRAPGHQGLHGDGEYVWPNEKTLDASED